MYTSLLLDTKLLTPEATAAAAMPTDDKGPDKLVSACRLAGSLGCASDEEEEETSAEEEDFCLSVAAMACFWSCDARSVLLLLAALSKVVPPPWKLLFVFLPLVAEDALLPLAAVEPEAAALVDSVLPCVLFAAAAASPVASESLSAAAPAAVILPAAEVGFLRSSMDCFVSPSPTSTTVFSLLAPPLVTDMPGVSNGLYLLAVCTPCLSCTSTFGRALVGSCCITVVVSPC